MTSPVDTATGVLTRPFRSVTIGLVGVETVVAFEYLAAATAMPTVVRELDGVAQYGLAFGGTLAAAMVCTVVSGIWTDASGPRRPLWTGMLLLTLGLAVAGTAQSMTALITGRVVQGFGGGLILVAVYVIVAGTYPTELKPRIFAALAAAWVVPAILGPVVVGAIVTYAGWRWVFLAAGLLVLPLGALLHPATANATGQGVPDRAAAGRAVGWAVLAAVSIALLQVATQSDTPPVWPLLAALAALAVALRRLLPAGTFRVIRGLPTVIALRGLSAASFVAVDVFMPLLLARQRGLSPMVLGIAISVAAVSWPIGSWWQSRPGLTWSHSRLIRTGAIAMASGTALVAALTIPQVPLPVGLAGWVCFGLGMGLIYPSLPARALDLSAPGEAGRNSSALQLADATANTVSVTIAGALFALLLPLGHIAFLGGFGLAFGCAVLAALTAGRVVPTTVVG